MSPAARVDVDQAIAAIELEVGAAQARFDRRSGLILEATDAGLIDYLTCPACRALVPIPLDASWPDVCPRCGRCV